MKSNLSSPGLVLFAALSACGNGAGGPSQTGGTPGRGGASVGGGGSASTGGVASSGGTGMGGSRGNGGGTGQGGTFAAGGASGSGGSGSGGSGSGGTIASTGTGGTGAGGAGTGGAAGRDAGAGGTLTGTGGVGTGGSGTGGVAGRDAGTGGTSTGTGGTGAGGLGSGGVAGRDAGAGGTSSTGGTSGRDGGGGAGGATYQPCPSDGNPCKILPFGDSITFGVNDEGNGGYRGPLFALAVAAQQKLTFTGSLSNGPSTVSGQTFPKKNEGHSGWGISRVTPYSGSNAGIATVIPSPALDSGNGGIPNIILLHIGTNDQGSFTASQMTSDLAGLLDKIITAAPNALLVVAQIIPLGYGTNDVIKAYNQAIPALVQQRAAAGKHVALLDMYTGFSASTMLGSDSIHPNSTGYKFMADHWYSVIGSLLPN